jgi:DNA repair exonuclease SbcCD ATPase subunit
MRETDYTLEWLDTSAARQIRPLLQQIREARAAKQHAQAIRLCDNFFDQAEQSQQHAVLGLVLCQKGETYRLMDIPHHQDAVDAFGRARLRFTLDGNQPASSRNVGVAHWSLAVVHENMREEWDAALRHFQMGMENVDRAREHARIRRDTGQIRDLDTLFQTIEDDYKALLKQYSMEDPRLEGAARLLEDASKATEELSAKIKEAARQSELAADHATGATAKLVQELETARAQLLKDIQAAIDLTKVATDQTKAAAAQAAQASAFLTQRLNEAREQLLQDIQQAAEGTQKNVDKTNQALEKLVQEAIQAIRDIRREADDAGGLTAQLTAASEGSEYCLELMDKGQEAWSKEDEFFLLRRTESGDVTTMRVPTQAEKGPEGKVVAVLRRVS